MAKPAAPEETPNALGLLTELRNFRRQKVTGSGLDPRLASLRQWQSARLARSYADLLAHPRFAPAARFFLDDIYSPRDFSQRDHDLLQLHDFMRRFVPPAMFQPLTLTVKLHALTERLDRALATMLFDTMKVAEVLLATYCDAYRRCDNFAERVSQIELIGEIGRDLDRIVRQPLTGTVLAVAARPARRAGWGELTGFLERGYQAFKHLRGARPFLDLVRRRETRYLDRIYAGDPDPYGWSTGAAESGIE
ncbi:MAG: hypothetical protein IT318_20635 [Anaerolineales bacterium]|nr:hypothetical protein [Anaerolineales bacterium]